jgi:hypothetical protein
MSLQEIVIKSLKNIFFGLIAFALALPLLLSVPVVREYFISAISMIGIGD